MRKIKFRGKRVDNDEWIYGSLISDEFIVGQMIDFDNDYFETEFWYRVKQETIGQFTGRIDIANKEIYEGHTIHGTLLGVEYKGLVIFDDYTFSVDISQQYGEDYVPCLYEFCDVKIVDDSY